MTHDYLPSGVSSRNRVVSRNDSIFRLESVQLESGVARRSVREHEENIVIRIISTLVLGLLVAATGVASAQDVDKDVDEKAMERKVRDVAIAIGNAYVCIEKEGQQAFKKESHLLFNFILQDVGSDLAFVYATGIGYGSSLPKEKLDCPLLLKQWGEFREDYELTGGEG